MRAVPAPAARPAFLAHPRLRRTSPITHYAAAAMLEALKNLEPDSARRIGLVVCLQSGCVQYTYRFFAEALADPATASPLLFPETVFAAPASHLAALLENTPLVSTLMGDPATFAQGLALGADWLRQERVDVAVVIGAEEINWLRADALWHLEHAAIISGGAGAVALCREPEFSIGVELAAITKPQSYSARKSRVQAARAMREEIRPVESELLCDGLGDSPRADGPEMAAWRDWPGATIESKKNSGRRPHGRRRVAMRGRVRRRGGKRVSLGHRQPRRLQPAGDGRPFSGLPRHGQVGQAWTFKSWKSRQRSNSKSNNC